MYLGRVAELPDLDLLLPRVLEARGQDGWEGLATEWDFGKSNHFVTVVEFDEPLHGDRFGVLCHGSGPELRGPGPHGIGLYVDQSPRLRELARRIDTPWGPLLVLADQSSVCEYLAGYSSAEECSRKRRTALAERLVPGVVEVSNTTHQGLLAPNDINLGCVVESGDELVPVTLRADLPIHLMVMTPSLSDASIQSLGFAKRAEETGAWSRLAHANLLPHGGGYSVPGYKRLVKVIEREGARIFEIEPGGRASGRAYHSSFRHIPFGYRGEEVVRRAEELGLGSVVNRARPLRQFMI